MYRCTFHVVWCPKYHRPVIKGDIDVRLKEITRQVCGERGAHIAELETMPDHVHLLIECDSQYGIHRLVKQIKGTVLSPAPSGVPAPAFAVADPLDEQLFVATVGGATVEVVKQYVANQRNV